MSPEPAPTPTPASFALLDEETLHTGHILTVKHARFRYADGGVVERDVIRHGGAVAVVALEDDHVILVRQPREATGIADLLELPAGRLDRDGEPPEETAARELAEEVGRAPGRLEHLTTFFTSAGFTDERLHLYLAEDLRPAEAESGEDERITIVRWPLADLDGALAACEDAKTLIGLLMLKARLAATAAPEAV